MVSTVYKGDLAEVTFGHECGVALKHGAFGAGAVATLTTSPTSAGSGYSVATVATTGGAGDGNATVAIASIANGVVITSAVDDAGATYAGSDNVTQASSSGVGTGFTATINTVAGGAVVTYTMTAGGSGYAANEVITMTGGSGSGLKFVVTTISNGVITALTASAPAGGAGYNVGDVLTLGTGTGGTATVATLTAGGLLMTKTTNSANSDCTDITFTQAKAGMFDANQNLKYPAGMLVGSTLRVRGSSANYDADDYATTGNTYTIVANSANVITVTPKMKENGASGANDEILIDTIGTPTMDTGMTYNASAKLSDESVLTDQFVGLAATVSLPETKVEIRRSHVIGLGRDVVIQ